MTFNRPMVPLQSAGQRSATPPGWHMSISPNTPGEGTWVGTSTWVFHPQTGLRPSTTYSVVLDGHAADQSGDTLVNGLAWNFRTVAPQAISRSPRAGARFVGPHAPISITFNQRMDRASTASALRVWSDGRLVAGNITWNGTRLLFRPSRPLTSTAPYAVTLAGTARSATGPVHLTSGLHWSFRAAPLPTLRGSVPANGGTSIDRECAYCYAGYYRPLLENGYLAAILLNTPMSKASLDSRLSVSPSISHLHTSFGGPGPSGNFRYTVTGDFAPSTSYTITLRPGARDRFGRVLKAGYSFQFETGQLYPSVSLYGVSGQSTISASSGRSVNVPLQLLNVRRVHFRLVHTDASSLLGCCYASGYPAGKTVRTWTTAFSPSLNKVLNVRVRLSDTADASLPAGIYYVVATATGPLPGLPSKARPPTTSETVVVRNVAITMKQAQNGTLIWVTSEKDGQPLANSTVRLLNYDGDYLKTGTTGVHGVAFFPPGLRNVGAAVVRAGQHFGFAATGWSPDVTLPSDTPYTWSQFGSQPGGDYVYTDRPVYRPGQTVHFRAVLWHDSDGVYSRSRVRTAKITAQDAYGKRLLGTSLTLDRFGSLRGSFRIPETAHTGDGYLSVRLPTSSSAATTFTIADYRKPEFLATVQSARPSFVRGQTVRATVRVRYVFGTPVARQRVRWTAYAQPRFPDPPGWSEFSFFDWESYWRTLQAQGQSGTASLSNPTYTALGTQVVSGSGLTDAHGRIDIEVPARRFLTGTDATVTIEATATDAGKQQVSGRTTLPVYRSSLLIGLDASHGLVPAGQKTSVRIVSATHTGKAIASQRLSAIVARRTYTNRLVQGPNGASVWKAIPHDSVVSMQSLVTDGSGRTAISFTPSHGGEYVVTVSGHDVAGNPTRAISSIVVSVAGSSGWGPSAAREISLKPDRLTYNAGDTAHLAVASPFANATALITVERGDIRKYWVRRLVSQASTVDVPLTVGDVPNVYVTVTLYRGYRNGSPPDWRYGVQQLRVRVTPRRLIVRLRQNGAHHHPGDRVRYSVTTTDASGRPVSARLSLALVDTAVLALKHQVNANIVQNFYGSRALDVQTSADGAISVDSLSLSPSFRLAPASIDGKLRLPINASGGGGGGPPAGVTVRSNFADTAYWTGSLTTDSHGRAHLAVKLPDDATTWRMDARGVTALRQVGQATIDTRATRDIILSPVTPRFLVEGDSVSVGAVVHNNTAHPVRTTVSVAARGITLRSAQTRSLTIQAGGQKFVKWPGSVPPGDTSSLTFSASSHSSAVLGDAVQLTIPVEAPLTDETTATAGMVFGHTRQVVIVPPDARSTPGSLSVQVSATLTSGLGRAFSQLRPTPYESNDDVASRVIAAAALRTIPFNISGMSRGTYQRLPATISAGVRRLLDLQFGDGGWPWFNDAISQSDPSITADAVQALSMSGWHGPRVRRSIQAARSYLRRTVHNTDVRTHAHILETLAISGAGGTNVERFYGNSIQRLHLDPGSLADTAVALRSGGERSRAGAAMSVLDADAMISATGAHWEAGGWRFWSGPPIGVTTQVLHALLQLSPHDELIPATVRWLMLARDNVGWDCASDTAQAIAVLAQYARLAREGTASYSYRISVNAATVASGAYGARSQDRVARAVIPIARLTRESSSVLDMSRAGIGGTLGPARCTIWRAFTTFCLPVR